MVNPQQYRPSRRRPQQSLRQDYEEFILQRIEEFKDQLSREELLAIADEAVRELEVSADEQLVLTEVLVLEHVDRLIMRRLHLPTFRRWRDKHVRLRRAQREPTHWGLDPHTPLAVLASSLPEQWMALVVGGRARGAAFFLAAHDWPVLFLDQELGAVEQAETRAAAEALAQRFQALVVRLGTWFPDVEPGLTVLDLSALERLSLEERQRFLTSVKRRTPSGGVHYLIPSMGDGAPPLEDEHLRHAYRGWEVQLAGPRTPGMVVKKVS